MFSGVVNLDLTWVCLTGALVMLMQAGFCCVESGLVREKNSINVAIKNLIDFCIASIVFWGVGFGLMFGRSWHGLVGTSHWAIEQDTPQVLAYLFFQLVFCGTSTTIISGAVAERMKFGAYLIVALVVSAVVYPVFGHWAWNNTPESPGWLRQLGFIDFSGASVVHSIGGWFALGALMVLGPRIGRFQSGSPAIQGCNIPLATLGVFLMWFGWYGFNAGSTLHMTAGVPLILLNTTFGAAAGTLGALAIGYLKSGHIDVMHLLTGTVAGLVSVTAGCHLLPLWAGIVVGGIGGALSILALSWLEHIQIDDAVAAIPVHAVGGAWGTIAVGLFGRAEFFTPGMTRWEQLGIQLIGAVTAFVWAFPIGVLVCLLIDRTMGLRVPRLSEIKGLNFSEHGATTELADLLHRMDDLRQRGNFQRTAQSDHPAHVGQIVHDQHLLVAGGAAESALKETAAEPASGAEDRYLKNFRNAAEGIFQSTPQGHYLNANLTLARIYGYETVDELRSSVSDIGRQLYVDPARRDLFMEIMQRDGFVVDFESEVYRCDGQRIWISESAEVVRDEHGRVLYYEGTVVDITISLHHAELQRLKHRAEAASDAKSSFLAKMSHEIRTPLNGVVGMLDLLAGTPLSEKQQQYVRLGSSSASALLSIINDILDFSKIEAGKLELEHIEFDLPELLEEVREMFGPQAAAKSIALTCHIEQTVPARVIGDPARLRQILMNFVTNALKFTAHGEIQLSVTRSTSSQDLPAWRVTVRDTGLGILPEKLPCLFQAFSQMSASDSRTHGGTGLGLAICKQLVDLMGGQIGVESLYGQGSTFWFEVPLHMGASHTGDQLARVAPAAGFPMTLPAGHKFAQQGYQADTQRSASERPRLLIVEDNEINQMVLQELLERAGYECEVAGNGQIALEAIQERSFAAVLTDCGMPVMDGWELVQAVRNWEYRRGVTQPLPCIAVTASAIKGDREKCLAAGMSEYLTKPIDREKLLATLRRYVDPESGIATSAPTGGRPQATPESIIIDLPSLNERCGADNEFIRLMLNKFSERSQTDLRELQILLVGNEYEMLSRKAHNLKGSAANISAIEVARLAELLCDAAGAQNATGCANHLDTLHGALTSCRTWIATYTGSTHGEPQQPKINQFDGQTPVFTEFNNVLTAEQRQA